MSDIVADGTPAERSSSYSIIVPAVGISAANFTVSGTSVRHRFLGSSGKQNALLLVYFTQFLAQCHRRSMS
jgi:hypothetical protein